MAGGPCYSGADVFGGERPKLHSLTGLRFLAAFWVLLYHCREAFETLPAPLRLLIDRGYVAVPLFFVLSGFVLTYKYAAEDGLRGSKSRFWRSRFNRIYPTYFLAFLLFAPIAWVKTASPLTTALFTVTLTQTWVGLLSWNTPGWSLSAEAFFYFVFPFLMPLLMRVPLRWLGAVSLLSLVPAFTDSARIPLPLPEFHPLCHLIEFILGIVACRVAMNLTWSRSRIALLTAADAVLLLVLLCFVEMPDFALHTSLLAIPMSVLICGLAGLPWLSHPWLIALGDASYGLYVLQSPLHVYVKNALHLTLFRHTGYDDLNSSVSFQLSFAAIAIAVSLLSFRVLEDPARKLLNGRRQTDAPVPSLAGC